MKDDSIMVLCVAISVIGGLVFLIALVKGLI